MSVKAGILFKKVFDYEFKAYGYTRWYIDFVTLTKEEEWCWIEERKIREAFYGFGVYGAADCSSPIC